MERSVVSEEMLELLNDPPVWPLRFGIMIVLSILLLAILFATFIQFPQTVDGVVHLSSDVPIIRQYAARSAHIKSLLVENGDNVKKGQAIIQLSSGASWADFQNLEQKIDILLRLEDYSDLSSISEEVQFEGIPSLQAAFFQLIESADQLDTAKLSLYRLESDLSWKKRKELIAQKITIGSKEKELMHKKLMNQREGHYADSLLFNDSVITKMEFNSSALRVINAQADLIVLDKQIINYRIELNREDKLRKEQLAEFRENVKEKKSNYRKALNAMIKELNKYKENNLMIAERNGKLRYSRELTEGELLKEGEETFTIDSDYGELYAFAEINPENGAKIKEGQRVIVRLDPFPHSSYGKLEARIQDVNPVIVNDSYKVKIRLIEGLRTDKGIELPYLPEMTGQARIICEEQSLLERIIARSRTIILK